MALKIEILDKNGGINAVGYRSVGLKLLLANKYPVVVKFDSNPTANCQVFGVSPITNMIDNGMTPEEFNELLLFIRTEFDHYPYQLLFDLNKEKMKAFKKLIGGHHKILFEQSYTSTNNSEMVMGLVVIDLEHCGISLWEDEQDEDYGEDDDN